MARRPKPWYRKARRSWFVTIAGVQHNLGPSKAEAYEQFHQLMRQPLRSKVHPESLVAVADAFLDWVQKNRSAATFGWYRGRLQRFLRVYPDLRVSELKPFHVQKWVDQGVGHSPTTKRNNIRAVKRCLAWAAKQGYIERDPIADLEAPSPSRREQIVTPDQFDEILAAVPDQAFTDLLRIVWETGCRPQECLRVEGRHVDELQGRWIFPASEAKMKAMPRVVYLTSLAAEITERMQSLYSVGPLFRNSQGNPWDKDSVSCAFDRLRVRLGKTKMKQQGIVIANTEIELMIPHLSQVRIVKGETVSKSNAELRSEARRKLTQRHARVLVPSLSLYTLRHSWATNALKRGVDALTVAILMGHKDPSTLARTYQHLSHDPKHLLKQAKRAAG